MVDILLKISNIFKLHVNQVFLIEAMTGRQFSYGEFYHLACKAARMLYAKGIRKGDRVAIVMTNSAEFAALYFGCLFLGVVAVPVNLSLHPREVSFVVGHTGAKLIIFSPATKNLVVESSLVDSFPTLCLLPLHEQNQAGGFQDLWFLNAVHAPEIPDWQPMDGVRGDDLFSITFTSGTTSIPKGVAHRISGLLENAIAFNKELGFGPDNRFLHVVSMAYMAGFLNTLLCPFMAEGSVVLTGPFDAQTMLRFWQPVIQYRADTLWLAPTMLAVLIRLDRDTVGMEYCRARVKTICVGTAPLPLKTKKDFELKYGVEIFESYGLSELLFVSGNSNRFSRLDGSVGVVLPGIDLRVVNEQGESTAPGEDGEIWIKTPYIMAGYLNYQTSEPDPIGPDDWFPTGDIGHVNSDVHLFITGRKKDLIIRGGINISPRVVEEVLLEHEAVDQAAVIGLPHDFYGEEVVAVVKLKAGHTLNAVRTALVVLCKKNLSVVSVPTKFFELDEFPISTTGKVQKAKLRELLADK